MGKLLSVFVIVMLLASCAPAVQVADDNRKNYTDAVIADDLPVNSLSSSASPEYTDKSVSVSEAFCTDDLELFFTLSSGELCALLGDGFEQTEWTISYSRFGAMFEYGYNTDDDYILFDSSTYEEEPALQRIVLYSFNFRGLNPLSGFDAVTNTLGETSLLANHEKGSYYYTLRYSIGGLQFDFCSPDDKGVSGITLAVTPFSESQVYYLSCGSGEPVSQSLTTGDIESFLVLRPEELDSIVGNGQPDFDEDTGIYYIYFDYLDVGFSYYLEEDEQKAYPVNPLEYVWIEDFYFRGVDKDSSFEEIKQVLGERDVREIPIVDASYFALQYDIDGMLFEFSSWDEQASKIVYLRLMPG